MTSATPQESARVREPRGNGSRPDLEEMQSMNELEQPIARMFGAYEAAVLAKDVDAFVALYDQDVCVFDMRGQWSQTS